MQEFTNPAGPRIEDTEKPHPNEGGSHDNGIPPKTPVDDTAVQMNGAETLPVKAKKLDLDKPEDFQDKFWKVSTICTYYLFCVLQTHMCFIEC